MNGKKLLYTGLILLLLLITGAGFYGYHQLHPQPTINPNANPDIVAPAAPTTSGETPPAKTYPISVFFSKHPESDNDPSATFALSRISPDNVVGKFAINELLKGPGTDEASAGYFTTARLRATNSNCGGDDFALTIDASVATLKFCKPFDHLGVVADGQAESEIKASLLQFSNIKRVVILNNTGNCEFDLSGLELCKKAN